MDLEKLINQKFCFPAVVLETMFSGAAAAGLFTDFSRILTFNYGDDPDLFFEKIEGFLNRGLWVCGFFCYEFGYFLEPALFPLREKNDFPLVWLGVCKQPKMISPRKKYFASQTGAGDYVINNLSFDITVQEYHDRIERIKRYLREGLTYQVNFTFKSKFDFEGNVYDFYQALKRAQPTDYTAFINTGTEIILSLSPELFFLINGRRIIARPMKGTARRGRSAREDEKNKAWLSNSEKIKAENVMIVDLLRNDLGRLAEKVWVTKLFEIEKYRTLYQMTSTIEAKLKKKVSVKEIFSALFPCGSVTGAPKIKTMQIIKELEKTPRGVYTGAIGYISPRREMGFNVAIRTVHLKDGKGNLGIGGGIVYDSVSSLEYEEALLKAKFFIDKYYPFSLVETILWHRDEGYFLLPLHLERLIASGDYFFIPIEAEKLKNKLAKIEKELSVLEGEKFKVRVSVNEQGLFTIEKRGLPDLRGSVKIKVSSKRTNSKDIFFYHKTTNRRMYDEELNRARQEGFFDVLFLNQDNQVTEGAITNIFIEIKGKLYTPPVECGLLNGVLREFLLRAGKAKEKIIFLQDIIEADKVYAGNSVRGLREAVISSENKNLTDL